MAECDRRQRAWAECERRHGRAAAACRHLNRALAICLVSTCCPAEADAVQSLCASAGTSLKRQQCHKAQINLSLCLSAHQQPTS